MKRILLIAIALLGLGLASCKHLPPMPIGVVLYAQSVPAVVHATWSPNPAGDNVTGYVLTIDGGAPQAVAPAIDASCSCVKAPVTVPSFGAHTVRVVAQNQMLSTDPTSQQTSPPAAIAFTLSPPPSDVKNAAIGK